MHCVSRTEKARHIPGNERLQGPDTPARAWGGEQGEDVGSALCGSKQSQHTKQHSGRASALHTRVQACVYKHTRVPETARRRATANPWMQRPQSGSQCARGRRRKRRACAESRSTGSAAAALPWVEPAPLRRLWKWFPAYCLQFPLSNSSALPPYQFR